MYYIYKAQITNDQGEVQAAISASSLESLEEQLHKLKAFDLKFVPDEPYEEQRDDEATESNEPEVDHYEETLQNIELNNQSLIS
jgi:hypothetical protein